MQRTYWKTVDSKRDHTSSRTHHTVSWSRQTSKTPTLRYRDGWSNPSKPSNISTPITSPSHKEEEPWNSSLGKKVPSPRLREPSREKHTRFHLPSVTLATPARGQWSSKHSPVRIRSKYRISPRVKVGSKELFSNSSPFRIELGLCSLARFIPWGVTITLLSVGPSLMMWSCWVFATPGACDERTVGWNCWSKHMMRWLLYVISHDWSFCLLH